MKLKQGIIRVSFRREDFRISFLQPFLIVFFSALIISELVFAISGDASQTVLFFVLPCLVTILGVTAVGLLRFRCKYQLSHDGIDCIDFWSRSRRTQWESIADVQITQTAGLKYLKIAVSGTKRGVLLPLFVSRPAVLKELMSCYLDRSQFSPGKLNEWLD